MNDKVNHPQHYNQLDIECIEIIEHFNFCLGSAIKYIWRAEYKGNTIEDLKKAIWYLEREIERLEKHKITVEKEIPFSDDYIHWITAGNNKNRFEVKSQNPDKCLINMSMCNNRKSKHKDCQAKITRESYQDLCADLMKIINRNLNSDCESETTEGCCA